MGYAGLLQSTGKTAQHGENILRQLSEVLRSQGAQHDEFEVERREVQGHALAPNLEGANLLLAPGIGDQVNMPGHIGMDGLARSLVEQRSAASFAVALG